MCLGEFEQVVLQARRKGRSEKRRTLPFCTAVAVSSVEREQGTPAVSFHSSLIAFHCAIVALCHDDQSSTAASHVHGALPLQTTQQQHVGGHAWEDIGVSHAMYMGFMWMRTCTGWIAVSMASSYQATYTCRFSVASCPLPHADPGSSVFLVCRICSWVGR